MITVCPKCDVALIIMEYEGIQVDFCWQCEGLWLDRGELEALLAVSGAGACDPLADFWERKPRHETGRPPYLCPRCDRPLKEIVKRCRDGSELRLDRCPREDGLWFDRDEFRQLVHSLPESAQASGALDLLKVVTGPRYQKTEREIET